MKPDEFIALFRSSPQVQGMIEALGGEKPGSFRLSGMIGSSRSLLAAAVFTETHSNHMAVLPDKESAAYFMNDLESLFGEKEEEFFKKQILLYPTTYKKAYTLEDTDNTNVLLRTEVIKRLHSRKTGTFIVTWPEALAEKVVTQAFLQKNTMKLKVKEAVSIDFVTDLLAEFEFERVDFVAEPGQFAVRGGIIDVFSFTNENPYRIEFDGDLVESLRSFNPATQLSIDKLDHITILPNMQERTVTTARMPVFSHLPANTAIWVDDLAFTCDRIDKEMEKAEAVFEKLGTAVSHLEPGELFIYGKDLLREIGRFHMIEFGKSFFFKDSPCIEFDILPQPSFHKNFDLLAGDLLENLKEGVANFICSDNPRQLERIWIILQDLAKSRGSGQEIPYNAMNIALHEGFLDRKLKVACYTDHQIFERYHRYQMKDSYASKEAITLRELYALQPGDFVTHIDHGVGRFGGLEKIDINGKQQEAIRLVYQNNDLLYISIHSLHRIAKYTGKDGSVPGLDKLGSNAWNRLKNKTKQKVKDIAKDLIRLYAARKSAEGFAFSPDTYLQYELEAFFIYEDTPDQVKATLDVKKDLEAPNPMDRLICGDVGFGKTEIAVRAAFKAVADSKQVAVLVPTTILALQHFKTFGERLKDFPCRVEYISRFKSTAAQHDILRDLEKGQVDILIGTHRLISKDIKFKDLGLLVIDEEQKFGVAAKEKLKQLRVNVDTLTLTATPIPRTLQFSLMGARDLSIINTPPPNRFPIQTELHVFSEEVIRDAIYHEVNRGGQVFFVHNRVLNILEVAGMIRRFCPDVTIAIAHGQMDGHKLEQIMVDFIEGDYDVLLATTIIESGLDIPNVNTIIINDAHHYGLSDLHQLRGRVGRSNKKAFCYLLSPPLSVLTDDARKRLKAIEEFSDLGSGFNIAMRDLDIRGAGNLLGAEQSGFIADIGFEMYHKILDEALNELKEQEFRDLFPEEAQEEFVKDCVIETDLEILIPDDYVNSITERLSLYKELDNVGSEEHLMEFQARLIDRFGPIPLPTAELISTIRLRWLAGNTGFEKIALRGEKMTGFFVSSQESAYYQSPMFTQVLNYVQANPRACAMKEGTEKLTLTFRDIRSVDDAIGVLRAINPGFTKN